VPPDAEDRRPDRWRSIGPLTLVVVAPDTQIMSSASASMSTLPRRQSTLPSLVTRGPIAQLRQGGNAGYRRLAGRRAGQRDHLPTP
jgi:hypothetical protein